MQITSVSYNGSPALSFHDWSNGLRFSLPQPQPVFAIGFEYGCLGPEVWTLIYGSLRLPLTSVEFNDYQPCFIGITDTSSPQSSFILRCGYYAQHTFLLDDLSYAVVPEPATAFLFSAGILFLTLRKWSRRQNRLNTPA
jgi:hypothetical protein